MEFSWVEPDWQPEKHFWCKIHLQKVSPVVVEFSWVEPDWQLEKLIKKLIIQVFSVVLLGNWIFTFMLLQTIESVTGRLYIELCSANIAYRSFVRWCWGSLGRRVRVVCLCGPRGLQGLWVSAPGSHMGQGPGKPSRDQVQQCITGVCSAINKNVWLQ